MVEGHSVHRVAAFHRQRLVGKAFAATSPNGRFTAGAAAIDGKIFHSIEAVGKNLFAFFGSNENDRVTIHVHFGMSGAWAVFDENDDEIPEPSKTNRLRLQGHGLVADLSAMTVNWSNGMNLYQEKRTKLGQDPLRNDADPESLWTKVSASKKSIGALIMDQSYFTGPGNIYRAEILFKAGVHPDVPGNELERTQFDEIWKHTCQLLQRGYETGSILTVDKEEAIRLGKPNLRRYIYNTRHCPRCGSNIQTWDINARTCYACPTCQPRHGTSSTTTVKSAVVTPDTSGKRNHVPFHSHCARESAETRLSESGPSRLTVVELKTELAQRSIEYPTNSRKAVLVQLLTEALQTTSSVAVLVSSKSAAMEKARAHESLAVEHIAELAPVQARQARRAAKQKGTAPKRRKSQAAVNLTKKRQKRAARGT
jgi:formamidopyrimidine-DNA glycosylase